jgi:hypothetical protein
MPLRSLHAEGGAVAPGITTGWPKSAGSDCHNALRAARSRRPIPAPAARCAPPHGREFTPKRPTRNILRVGHRARAVAAAGGARACTAAASARDCDRIVADAKLRMSNMREVPVNRALPRVFARDNAIFQIPEKCHKGRFLGRIAWSRLSPNRLVNLQSHG